MGKRKQKELMRAALQQGSYAQPQAYGGAAEAKGGSSVPLAITLLVLLFAAAALGAAILYLNLHAGAQGAAEGGGGENAVAAPLGQTADAGQGYVNETLFLGDSNTVALGLYALVEEDQVLAQAGLGIGAVAGQSFVTLPGRQGSYTMAQAVGILKPARILMGFGTNDIGNITVEAFIDQYGQAIEALQKASPQTVIVVNAIPPVSARHAYPKLSISEIERYNDALLTMCRQKGIAYLNSYEALLDEEGYGASHHTGDDGLHLTSGALQELLHYYRTHACQP